jgi:hypothetical protein
MVMHACNPSFFGSGGRRIDVQDCPGQNAHNPFSKITEVKSTELDSNSRAQSPELEKKREREKESSRPAWNT